MRILHCLSSIDPRAGGPVTAVAGLARAQAAFGQEVCVLANFGPTEQDTLALQLAAQGVRVERVGPCVRPMGRHPQLKRATQIEVARADVVHIHGLWEEIQHQAAKAAQRMAKPYILTPHGMLDPWSLKQSRLKKQVYLLWRLRWNLDRAAAIHFTSEIERDLAGQLKLKPPAIVESNGIDLAEFETLPAAGTFRHRYSQIGDRPFLLYLGRIHYKKGLDLLIPAFAEVDGGPMLVIAGPDSDGYQSEVEGMVRRCKLEDRVIFTGMLHGPDRIAALRDADLFVLPSYQENFGIAVAESLAAGTAVIISDQVNIHREITAAGVGQAVPTEIAPLAAAMRDWLADGARRSAAAERARPFVWGHYDWNRIAQRWADHYQRLNKSSTP